MVHRYRFTRLALAAAILWAPLLACARPAEPPPVTVETAPAAEVSEEEEARLADLAAQATLQMAITRINPSTCVSHGNHDQTTVIDWEPTDPTSPDEVLWYAPGKPKGFRVVVEPKAGQPADVLAMFKGEYDSGPDGNRMLSGKPKNPPFGSGNEVRWQYSVIVYDAQGKEKCRVDPEICVRKPGGCEFES